MQFYEKLIFLQNLTQVTNRMLAHEIQVDPSQISRLRTGARGIPRNRDLIKAMSSYFRFVQNPYYCLNGATLNISVRPFPECSVSSRRLL